MRIGELARLVGVRRTPCASTNGPAGCWPSCATGQRLSRLRRARRRAPAPLDLAPPTSRWPTLAGSRAGAIRAIAPTRPPAPRPHRRAACRHRGSDRRTPSPRRPPGRARTPPSKPRRVLQVVDATGPCCDAADAVVSSESGRCACCSPVLGRGAPEPGQLRGDPPRGVGRLWARGSGAVASNSTLLPARNSANRSMVMPPPVSAPTPCSTALWRTNAATPGRRPPNSDSSNTPCARAVWTRSASPRSSRSSGMGSIATDARDLDVGDVADAQARRGHHRLAHAQCEPAATGGDARSRTPPCRWCRGREPAAVRPAPPRDPWGRRPRRGLRLVPASSTGSHPQIGRRPST